MFKVLVEVLNCCFCFKRKRRRKLHEEEIGISGEEKLTRIRFLPNKEFDKPETRYCLLANEESEDSLFEESELRRRIIS